VKLWRPEPHHAPPFQLLHRAEDPRVTTLPMPGYRQARGYTCGFAATLMVVRYFDPQASALELYRRLGTGADGTRQNAIVRVLRAAGVGANLRYDVDFSRVQREIDRGKPLIAYLHDTEHWIVLYGYGREPDRVFVADPEPHEPCERSWAAYRGRLRTFGIVCSGPAPRTAPDSVGDAAAPAKVERVAEAPSSVDRADDERAMQLAFPFHTSPGDGW
jgi:hypothetical protein